MRLALAVTQREQIPLFHDPHAGKDNDLTLLEAPHPRVLQELGDFGQGPLTWVYDGGNVSARAEPKVETGVARGELATLLV